MLERHLGPKVRNSSLYALVSEKQTRTLGEKGMVLLATSHIELEQLHERYGTSNLDQVMLRQQRAHVGVVHTGRFGNPSSLNDLHARALPI